MPVSRHLEARLVGRVRGADCDSTAASGRGGPCADATVGTGGVPFACRFGCRVTIHTTYLFHSPPAHVYVYVLHFIFLASVDLLCSHACAGGL